MWFILWLSCVTVIVSATVVDSNVSTGSKTTPAPTKKSDNQDSRIIEKSIKSLETTLEKNFQQLIHIINATSGGNRPDKPGKICLIMLLIVVFFFIGIFSVWFVLIFIACSHGQIPFHRVKRFT